MGVEMPRKTRRRARESGGVFAFHGPERVVEAGCPSRAEPPIRAGRRKQTSFSQNAKTLGGDTSGFQKSHGVNGHRTSTGEIMKNEIFVSCQVGGSNIAKETALVLEERGYETVWRFKPWWHNPDIQTSLREAVQAKVIFWILTEPVAKSFARDDDWERQLVLRALNRRKKVVVAMQEGTDARLPEDLNGKVVVVPFGKGDDVASIAERFSRKGDGLRRHGRGPLPKIPSLRKSVFLGRSWMPTCG